MYTYICMYTYIYIYIYMYIYIYIYIHTHVVSQYGQSSRIRTSRSQSWRGARVSESLLISASECPLAGGSKLPGAGPKFPLYIYIYIHIHICRFLRAKSQAVVGAPPQDACVPGPASILSLPISGDLQLVEGTTLGTPHPTSKIR